MKLRFIPNDFTLIYMNDWLDSIHMSDMPADTIPLVRQLSRIDDFISDDLTVTQRHINPFFKQTPDGLVLKELSELPPNISLEKTNYPKTIKQLDATQKAVAGYLNKIITRLYRANPEILGEQPPIQFELPYRLKGGAKGNNTPLGVYSQYWPPIIGMHLPIFLKYDSEDMLAGHLAHELVHLTLLRKISHIGTEPVQESLCDLMGMICAARAGYRPSEIVEFWQPENLHTSLPLMRVLVDGESPTILNNRDMENAYDMYRRGLLDLSDDELDAVDYRFMEIERDKPEQNRLYPANLTRRLYLTKLNNFLIDTGRIESDEEGKLITPVNQSIIHRLNIHRETRIPAYLKKLSPQLRTKLRKRLVQRQKQYGR